MENPRKIIVNGREYDGVEQMPPEVRREYLQAVNALGGDADGNGVPDALEKPGSSGVMTQESFVYDGREYRSRDELPPEVRTLLDQMPPPAPGEDGPSRLEIKTTRVFPPQVTVTQQVRTEYGRSARSGFPWLLVTGLIVAVLILLFLWLSDTKPGDLLRR